MERDLAPTFTEELEPGARLSASTTQFDTAELRIFTMGVCQHTGTREAWGGWLKIPSHWGPPSTGSGKGLLPIMRAGRRDHDGESRRPDSHIDAQPRQRCSGPWS